MHSKFYLQIQVGQSYVLTRRQVFLHLAVCISIKLRMPVICQTTVSVDMGNQDSVLVTRSVVFAHIVPMTERNPAECTKGDELRRPCWPPTVI